MSEKPAQKPFTAADRAKAIDIAEVSMYMVNHKTKGLGTTMATERFMVIRAANGRRYIFREEVQAPKDKILTPDKEIIT